MTEIYDIFWTCIFYNSRFNFKCVDVKSENIGKCDAIYRKISKTRYKHQIVYGDDAIAESTPRNRFATFRNVKFDGESREHFCRPPVFNDDQIEILIKGKTIQILQHGISQTYSTYRV